MNVSKMYSGVYCKLNTEQSQELTLSKYIVVYV